MQKILKYYKPYLGYGLIAVILLFLQAQCDLALPDYMSKIVSEGIAISDTSYIIQTGLIMLAISFIGLILSVIVGLIAAQIGAKSSRDIRSGLFSKVSHFSNDEFDKFSVSSLITRSTNDISQIQIFVIMLIRMVFYAPMMGVGGVIKAIDKSREMPQVGMVLIIAIGLLLVMIAFMLLIAQPKFTKIQKLVDKLNLVSREELTGMLVIRAFNTEKYEEKRFDEANTELTKVNLFINRVMVLMMPFMMLILNGVSLAVVWIASITASSIADVGNMMAFMQYAMQIIMSFMMVSMVFILMPRAIVSAKRINEVLKTDISIVNKKDAKVAKKLTGIVKFNNVSFKYHGSEEAVVENISFTASPSKTTAIIGSTGSGKSTIISLIPRLYDVTSGSITIDGTDLRDYTYESLRQNIGYVPQKNVLFSGTIADNIRYGNSEASDETLDDLATTAQAIDFIKDKEDGFDSEIAQGGANVSGGQKQRLAIARALAKEAPIYIFDDSFSALDFKTDAELRKALKKITTHSTVIIVAQRVGTIMDADQIIVLDDGKIAGIGTHKELLKSSTVYYDIASSQLSPAELEEV